MRKIICLLFIILLLCTGSVNAQTTPVISLTQQVASQASSAALVATKQESEYQLPYPGLLPDSPFYIFKTTRDKVVSFLISDPLKKAEFNLLQADKRLNAGLMQVNKRNGKDDLAESAISKGQNYFEDAIGNVEEAKKERITTNDIEQKLVRSAKKHIDVLNDLEKKVSKDEKEKFVKLTERMQKLQKKVNELVLKK
jgi:hypothetical protein